MLAAISEAERELDEDLAALEARELVLEQARDPELEYIFKHALVQEATYESILLQRRRELHREVAAAIEALFAERLEDFFGLLAYHYTKAEDWEKAQEYLFKAGDQAGSIAADDEALDHYEQALEAYTRAFGDRWDPLERAGVERKMGEAFCRRGDHERAREHLFRALATLGHPFPATPAPAPGPARQTCCANWSTCSSAVAPDAPPALADHRRRRGALLGLLQPGLDDAGGDQTPMLLALLLGPERRRERRARLGAAALQAWSGSLRPIPLPRLAATITAARSRSPRGLELPLALAHAYFFGGLHEYWATVDRPGH